MYILSASGVFSTVGWSRGVSALKDAWVSPCVATHEGVCVRVAVRMGMAEFVSFGLRGSSVPSVEDGTPRATDGGCLLGVTTLGDRS